MVHVQNRVKTRFRNGTNVERERGILCLAAMDLVDVGFQDRNPWHKQRSCERDVNCWCMTQTAVHIRHHRPTRANSDRLPSQLPWIINPYSFRTLPQPRMFWFPRIHNSWILSNLFCCYSFFFFFFLFIFNRQFPFLLNCNRIYQLFICWNFIAFLLNILKICYGCVIPFQNRFFSFHKKLYERNVYRKLV